jgi:hypothetical protein
LILAASLLAIAYPAAAQPQAEDYAAPSQQQWEDYPDSSPPPPAAARRLPPPGAVDAMGDRVAGIADALMDVDVGPAADAIDPGRRHRYRTLGEYATQGDPYARERMHRSIETGAARLSAAARELAIVAPMLMRSVQDAQRRMQAAMNAPVPPRGRVGGVNRSAPGQPAPPPSDYPFEVE